MADLTIESIFSLMAKNKMDPSTVVEFSVGSQHVNPKAVSLVVRGGGSYTGRKQYVVVELSTDFIDRLVQKRMKELFSAQVDAMFAEKEKTDA